MSRRAIIIVVSLVAHLGLAAGALVVGAWKIERLDRPRTASLALGVMLPPAAGGGDGEAAAAAPKPKLAPKRKRPVKEPVQPTKQLEQHAEQASAAGADPGARDGTGGGPDGDGDGPDGDGTCEGDACGGGGPASTAVCGDGRIEAPETCDDGNTTGGDGCSATCATEPPKPAVIPPNVLAGLRIAGETQIVPPDPVKTMMLRDGRARTTGSLKVCIGAGGGVTSVAIIGSTKYAAYDARLVAAVRGWRYRPYTIEGRPVASCSVVTFVYTIR